MKGDAATEVGPVEVAGFPSVKGEAVPEAAVPPNVMLLVAGAVVDGKPANVKPDAPVIRKSNFIGRVHPA